MTEEQRRKEFVKAAREVIKVWPGYAAHKFPAPTNRTDQCLQCDLQFSQKFFIEIWRNCRAGLATDADFNNELTHWKVVRMHTADMFNLGKPADADAVDKKKKQAIEAARSKCKFRTN